MECPAPIRDIARGSRELFRIFIFPGNICTYQHHAQQVNHNNKQVDQGQFARQDQ